MGKGRRFFSFGNVADGTIAIGNVAHGVVAIGLSLSVGVVAIGVNAVGSLVAIGVNAAAPLSLAAVNGLGILCFAGVNGIGGAGIAGVNGGFSPVIGGVLGVLVGMLGLVLRGRAAKAEPAPTCVGPRDAYALDEAWIRVDGVEAGGALRVGGEEVTVELPPSVEEALRVEAGRGAFVRVRPVSRPEPGEGGYREASMTRALVAVEVRALPRTDWSDPWRLHALGALVGALLAAGLAALAALRG